MPELHPDQKNYPYEKGCLQRIALTVEYNGSLYHGWQRQALPSVPTVQAVLEEAIGKVANHTVKLVCAGRTDAGVHAVGQVAHFDSQVDRPKKAWIQGVNSGLPAAVRVVNAVEVDEFFHARFSATARQYQYWIQATPVAPGIFSGQLTHFAYPLNIGLMHAEAQCLLGEQDCSAFRAAGCQSHTSMRNIHHVNVFSHGELVCIEIKANAFLLHMVRNIAGSLIAVGAGKRPSGWLVDLLNERDRAKAEATASPNGLYLQQVYYPEHFPICAEGRPLFFAQ